MECLLGFAFALDRHAENFRLLCRGLLLGVVVLLVEKVCDQFVQAMRNSDPRVRIVFVYRCKSAVFTYSVVTSTPYLPCKQQVATSNMGPILVFP